jgi:hypothetical protein
MRIEVQGKSVVKLWVVNKITDASGNAIDYVYSEDHVNGEYTLSRINYRELCRCFKLFIICFNNN